MKSTRAPLRKVTITSDRGYFFNVRGYQWNVRLGGRDAGRPTPTRSEAPAADLPSVRLRLAARTAPLNSVLPAGFALKPAA
jgi:hypothetical protein